MAYPTVDSHGCGPVPMGSQSMGLFRCVDKKASIVHGNTNNPRIPSPSDAR
jgi:hypothetical protein